MSDLIARLAARPKVDFDSIYYVAQLKEQLNFDRALLRDALADVLRCNAAGCWQHENCSCGTGCAADNAARAILAELRKP